MLKFALRLLKHVVKFLVIEVPLQLIGAIVLLVYLPIHLKLVTNDPSKSIRLPYILRIYDNADMYVGRDYSTYRKVFGSGYWNLYCWLAWRNPLNYYSYVWDGVTPEKEAKLTYTEIVFFKNRTDNKRNEIGDNDCPGRELIEWRLDGKTYYEYYAIYPYTIFGYKKCLRFRLGYKLGFNMAVGKPTQSVFVISPFHTYLGV